MSNDEEGLLLSALLGSSVQATMNFQLNLSRPEYFATLQLDLRAAWYCMLFQA